MYKRVMAVSAAIAVIAVPTAAHAGSAPRAAAAQEGNLVETAQAAGNFSTLVRLVQQAGLVQTLSGDDAYTVLAPTDAAFEKVPTATLRRLGNNRRLLRQVLLYHVIEGRVPARRVVRLRSAETVQGARVRIRVRGERVRINAARVTTTDVRASNGIIHVINRVLLPPS
jgi:uncharacterized surface protein with fasciclin (FAS1) repeats